MELENGLLDDRVPFYTGGFHFHVNQLECIYWVWYAKSLNTVQLQ